MVVQKPGVVQQLPDKVLPGTESTANLIGHINFDMKATGERNAGNPHVAFEVAGAGNGAKKATALVLDPTGGGGYKYN